jgi:hypothetical protein
MAEARYLCGHPSLNLVKQVKSVLRLYFAARPTDDNRAWKATWEWAHKSALRRSMFTKRTKWPGPSEIASMFIFLCLCEFHLHLPNRWEECLTPGVQTFMKERQTFEAAKRAAALADWFEQLAAAIPDDTVIE